MKRTLVLALLVTLSPTLRAAAGPCAGHALSGTPIAQLPTTRLIGIADVDGDGRADAVYDNRVAFGFTDVRTLPIDGRVAAVADVDNDGRADLITLASSAITAWISHADRTFTPVDSPLPGAVVLIAAREADGDRFLDLVVYDAQRIATYAGDGTGRFTLRGTSPLQLPQYNLAGDFNGDGRLDIVTTSALPQFPAALLAGDGNGVFHKDRNDPRLRGNVLAVADLDGDGRDDIVGSYVASDPDAPGAFPFVAFSGSDRVEVLRDTAAPQRAVTADFNGDRVPDLALIAGDGVSAPRTLALYINDRTGALRKTSETALEAFDLAAGDVNGDGAPEIVAAVGLRHELAVFFTRADGAIITPAPAALSGQATLAGDFDGDGVQDLLVPAAHAVAWNNRDLTFRNTAYAAWPFQRVLRALDVDGDGADEIVGVDGIYVLAARPRPDGTLVEVFRTVVPNFVFDATVVRNFHGDGARELAVLDTELDFFNARTGSSRSTLIGIPPRSGELAAGDFNGDGKDDLAMILNRDQGNVVAFITSDFLFDGYRSSVRSLSSLVTGDFNHDGITDAAVLDQGSVVVGDGRGDGFVQFTVLAGIDLADHLTSGDLDGDGFADLIATSTARSLSVVLPGGKSYVATGVPLIVGGNGRLPIVVMSSPNRAAVLLPQCGRERAARR